MADVDHAMDPSRTAATRIDQRDVAVERVRGGRGDRSVEVVERALSILGLALPPVYLREEDHNERRSCRVFVNVFI